MKIYFVTPADSPLADPGGEMLAAIRRAMMAEGGATETVRASDADALVLPEKYSFKEWRYIERILSDPLIGPNITRTYTINADDCATGLLRGVYTSLPSDRFDAAIHAIVPYTFYPNQYVLSAGPAGTAERRYLATWRGNPKSNAKLRGKLIQNHAGNGEIFVSETTSWLNHPGDEKKTYVDLMQAGKFSLCPAGWAPITFRVYESMALGVAPVVIADRSVLPPGPNWSECSIRVPEAALSDLSQLLKAYESRFLEMGKKAREAWERYFSPERAAAFYATSLLTCMERSLGSSNFAEEKRRMCSFGMYWSNEWTIPQRVVNKVRRLVSR
ncbi:MAG: exostosin family protein [Nibricoccus sp.]